MNAPLKRRQTGCLTCRSRRIKCDERKPKCMRCEVSNFECAGYAQKKQIDVRKSRRDASSKTTESRAVVTSSSPNTGTVECNAHSAPKPRLRVDGLPLVGLPNNLRYGQRPSEEARHVLGYHQFLFRTLPVLFPVEHMPFWRDRLCDEAWGSRYVFLAISALGTMHRASLLVSMRDDRDLPRGLDTMVIAMQTYTKSLEQLESYFETAREDLDVLIGVLVLMAYFECFSGNIPAMHGLVYTAKHYFSSLETDLSLSFESSNSLPALYTALQKLGWTCHMALPIPNGFDIVGRVKSPGSVASTTPTMHESLINILTESGMENITYMPVQMLPIQKIRPLQNRLREWKQVHGHRLPSLDSDTPGTVDLVRLNKYDFPIPPPIYLAVSQSSCLVGMMYSFLLARTMWALCIHLDGNKEMHEWAAYLHLHETMRFIASYTAKSSNTLANSNIETQSIVSCEALDVLLLPVMYQTAQFSPRPSWLHWILREMTEIGQQGIFDGYTYAAALNVLHNFELNSNLLLIDMMERYPDPENRIVSVMLPETAGRGFNFYFSRPSELGKHSNEAEDLVFLNIGQAHVTRKVGNGGGATCEVTMYEEQQPTKTPFPWHWLLSEADYCRWQRRTDDVEFNFDHVLRDHMNGSSLLH